MRDVDPPFEIRGVADVHPGTAVDEYSDVRLRGRTVFGDTGETERLACLDPGDFRLQYCGGNNLPSRLGIQAAFADGMNSIKSTETLGTLRAAGKLAFFGHADYLFCLRPITHVTARRGLALTQPPCPP